jgi:hypothetical protein
MVLPGDLVWQKAGMHMIKTTVNISPNPFGTILASIVSA